MMVFGLRVSKTPPFVGKKLSSLNDGMEHNVDCQKFRHPLKQKTVSSGSAPFLYHPDSMLDFRDMLVAAGQVDHRATWH
jgi:hypothetical protein